MIKACHRLKGMLKGRKLAYVGGEKLCIRGFLYNGHIVLISINVKMFISGFDLDPRPFGSSNNF